mmetsp:Transcript_38078/g.122255  ORF Transcript_38078/g.122255 Transcript_38078/m.122255 type:complete len:227 (-) Transcript_38078:967-1647(-)
MEPGGGGGRGVGALRGGEEEPALLALDDGVEGVGVVVEGGAGEGVADVELGVVDLGVGPEEGREVASVGLDEGAEGMVPRRGPADLLEDVRRRRDGDIFSCSGRQRVLGFVAAPSHGLGEAHEAFFGGERRRIGNRTRPDEVAAVVLSEALGGPLHAGLVPGRVEGLQEQERFGLVAEPPLHPRGDVLVLEPLERRRCLKSLRVAAEIRRVVEGFESRRRRSSLLP